MASKVKATASPDARLVKELEGISRRRRKSKSQLVQEALHLWRKRQIEQELIEGYRAMAEEDRTAAERDLPSVWELLRRDRKPLHYPSLPSPRIAYENG